MRTNVLDLWAEAGRGQVPCGISEKMAIQFPPDIAYIVFNNSENVVSSLERETSFCGINTLDSFTTE